jgi:hypothetical protein
MAFEHEEKQVIQQVLADRKAELATELVNDPDEQTEYDADHDAADNREIKGAVLATMDDVARETSEAKGEFASEVEECADDNEDCAENQKRAA